jgi:outer membrane protein TolC
MVYEGGIPMSYLAIRPDVRAAEKSFAAAYYATNQARTNFYPSLAISASGGFTNLLGTIITNPGKWFIQVAGQLTAPIFMRGQNIAALEAAKAQQQIALNNFQYTVLNAASEVSDALMEIKSNTVKQEALALQIDDLEKSVDYTKLLFSTSDATYLELLTARSSLLSAQMSALSSWYSKVNALIYLYQAVGGGK